MLKRMLTIMLVAAMLVTTAFAASVSDFTDFPSDWSAEAMEHAVENGLLEGSDNKINPSGKLTRAQMAAIMARAFGATATAPLDQYHDVREDAWYYEELSCAVQMGAMEGYGDTMRPNAPITRQEAFLVLSRLFVLSSKDTSALDRFTDGSQTAAWAEEGVAALVEAGYVEGNHQKKLKPTSSITRAEFAQVMDNMVSSYADGDTVLESPVNGNVMVRSDGKALKDLTIHGDLLLADSVASADLTNVTIEGRLVIRGGSNNLNLSGVQAKETVIDNPNDLTRLTVSDCRLGAVRLRSDVMVKGALDNVVEEGGHLIEDDTITPEPAKLVEQVQLVDMGWSQFVAIQFAKGNSLDTCTLRVDGVEINEAVTPVSDDGSIVKWEITDPGHAQLVISNGEDSQTVALGEGQGAAPQVVKDTAPHFFLLNGPVYVWDYHLTNYDDAGNIRVEPAKTTFALHGEDNHTIAHYSPDAIIHEDPDHFGKVTGTVELMFNYTEGTEAEKAFVDGITDVDLVSFQEYKQTLNDELEYTLEKEFVHGDHTVACIKVPIGQKNFSSNGRYRLRVTSNGTAYLFPIHLVNEVVPTMTITSDSGNSGKEVHFRINNMTYGITSPVYRVELTNPAGETSQLAKFDDWFLHGDILVLYNDHTNYFPVTGNYTVKVWADGFQPFEKTFHQTAFAKQAPKAAAVDAISTASVGGGGSSGGGEGGGSNVMNANLILNTDLLVNAEIVKVMGFDNAAALGIAKRWETMEPLYVFHDGAEKVYPYESYYDAVNTAKTQGKHLSFAQYTESQSAVTTQNRPYAVKHVLEDNLLGSVSSFQEAVGKAAPALVLTAQTEKTATFTCEDREYLSKLAEGELFLNTTYPALPASAYVVNAEAGTLTLNTVKVGRNTLNFRVPGYKTKEVVFEIGKVLEEVTLTAGDIAKGNPVVITCGVEHDTCDFFANITAVKLIAPNHAERVVLREGSESSFSQMGYTVEGSVLTIGKDIFQEPFAQNQDGTFQTGTYKAVLTASYYGEKTVTFQVTDTQEPIDPSEGQDAPAPREIRKHFYTGDYEIVFGMGQDQYMQAISNVTVNDEKTEYTVNNVTDGLLTISAAAMKKDAENMVAISAEGYQDLVFTVVLDAKGQPTLKPSEPTEPGEPDTAAAAPVVKTITQHGFGPGKYHKLAFEQYENITAYLNAVTGITIDGTEVTKTTTLWNSQKSYALSVVNSSQSVYDYDSIDFSQDCFGKGQVTVTITAEGYEPLTFHVTDGALAPTEPTEPAKPQAPAVANITLESSILSGKYYVLSFEGTEEEAAAFVAAIHTVTAGDQKLQRVNTFFQDTMSYKSGNDPVNGGAYQYLHFTQDCFAGEKTIVISADGYEDLTFHVNNGALVR